MENTADNKRKPEALDTFSTKERLFNKPYVHLLIIVIIALIAYSNTFNVPFHFDDKPNIIENPIIKDLRYFVEPSKAKDFTGPVEYPALKQRYIGHLSFALNYKAHGLDVRGYHITNLSIHMLNALLVYFLVLLTFRTPVIQRITNKSPHPPFNKGGNKGGLIALFAALLFVSHPIQTQAVTYIIQRLASLATMFYLLSLVAYIKWRLSSKNIISNPPIPHLLKGGKGGLFIISVLSAVLAMKTKEIAFTLPIVIALYEFMFFDGKIKKRLLYLVPLFLTMLIIPVSLIGLDKPIGDLIGDVSEATKVQTSISRWDYLFTQFRVIVTYIRLLFLPIDQNLDYDYPLFHSFFNPEVFLSFLFLLSLFGFGVYLFFRSRTSDSSLRLTAFGVFWFFITLSVESSIIPLHVIYEHRVYLPSVGALLALSSGVFLGFNGLQNKKVRATGIVFLILLPIVLSAATYKRNSVWKSDISLWEDVVRKSPGKLRGHNNLGKAYRAEGMTDKAIEHYLIALGLEPDYQKAYTNLGDDYESTDRVVKGTEYNKIASIPIRDYMQQKPEDYAEVYYNLGNAYESKGLPDKAMEYYKAALSLKHDHTNTLNNLGIIYFSKGLTYKAIEYYQMALRIEPDFVNAHYNLGKAYRSKGLSDKAIEHYNRALSLKPDLVGAYLNLASIYKSRGMIDEAIEHYNHALNLAPDIAEAHYNIGNAYMSKGLEDKAIGHYKHAIRLNPDDPDAHNNLGVAYKRKGIMDKAQEHFHIAERLKKQRR